MLLIDKLMTSSRYFINALLVVVLFSQASKAQSFVLIPSQQDKAITIKLKEALKFFDIKILDHIILTENLYFSFADEGIL